MTPHVIAHIAAPRLDLEAVALGVCERSAHDLRGECSAKIPGSHILTIHDLLRLKKLIKLAPRAYNLYRAIRLLVNPMSAIGREVNDKLQTQLFVDSASDGFEDNARLFLPATSYDRFAVTREINDGMLAPRFANSQRAWVLTGFASAVNPGVPASTGRDSDDR